MWNHLCAVSETDNAVLSDIDAFVRENETGIFRNIARLVAVNSVSGAPDGNLPFGKDADRALQLGLSIAAELGLDPVNCSGRIGYAQVGEGGPDCDRYLATVTHLDVVPCGDGWKEDPFTVRERDGYIIGRGVLDDKGPSVLCLYALKYLKDRGVSLRYPVRALLGIDEEVGMRDVEYYVNNYPAPLFCFSPDADFPMCNGEKGITAGCIRSLCKADRIEEISGGLVGNAVPDSARATVKAEHLEGTDCVDVRLLEPGRWSITAHGIGGHASMPDGTVNAIGVMVNYLLDCHVLSEAEEPYFRALSLFHSDTSGAAFGVDARDDCFQPLTIIGGMIRIEDGFFVQSYDSRYPTSTNGPAIADGLKNGLGRAVTVEMLRDTVPFYIRPDNPALQACLFAYHTITGDDASPYTIGGGTYARDFPNAVSFGPEHPERPSPVFAGPIHGVDEAANKQWLLEALKVYILALLKLEKLDF